MKSSSIFTLFLLSLLISWSCQSNHTRKETTVDAAQKAETSVQKSKTLIRNQVALTPAEKYVQLKVDSVFPSTLKKIPIQIINHTDSKVTMGTSYQLEYYDENLLSWENALPDNIAYTMLLQIIPPLDTLDLTIYHYTGKPGKYRVSKVVMYEVNNQKRNCLVIGEFILSNDSTLLKK